MKPYFSDKPGWAEQHPEYFWSSLCKACQQLWPKLDFPRERIKALSVTTQRATVIALDKTGSATVPCYYLARPAASQTNTQSWTLYFLCNQPNWGEEIQPNIFFNNKLNPIGLPSISRSSGNRLINFYCYRVITITD